jgi:hypothetical protein
MVCPECGTPNEADSIQSFPKNLALLNMSQTKPESQSSTKDLKSIGLIKSNAVKKPLSVQQFKLQPAAPTIPLCNEHDKKIEAYC